MTSQESSADVRGMCGEGVQEVTSPSVEQDVPAVGMVTGEEKKKKKKKRKKAKPKPTGFEEYFADRPLTVQEAAEEASGIYNPHLPFEDRIENCIASFRNRRRITQELDIHFREYLWLGGIDCNPAPTDPNLDPSETRGRDVIHRTPGNPKFYNTSETEEWDIDFAGVVAGFLSAKATAVVDDKVKRVEEAINIVDNFLRYIHYHDVCPEHNEGILQALDLCKVAKNELPNVAICEAMLPGMFHCSARQIYCPVFKECLETGFSPDVTRTRNIFLAAITLQGDPTVCDRYMTRVKSGYVIEISDEDEHCLEIMEIHRPDQKLWTLFMSLSAAQSPKTGDPVPPMGKLICKPCNIPSELDYGEAWNQRPLDEEFSIIMDDEILQFMCVGMKMRVILLKLDIGIYIIKNVLALMPTFYTFLPQQLMLSYRAPEPNDRPAPRASSAPGGGESATSNFLAGNTDEYDGTMQEEED